MKDVEIPKLTSTQLRSLKVKHIYIKYERMRRELIKSVQAIQQEEGSIMYPISQIKLLPFTPMEAKMNSRALETVSGCIWILRQMESLVHRDEWILVLIRNSPS